jgi:hypothetical protein
MSTVKGLNDGQHSALVTVCDTLIPAIDRVDDGDGFWARSASDMAIAQITEQLILTAMPEQAGETGELLSLLEREGFADASGDQRETQLWRLEAYPRESAGFLGYGDRSGSKQRTAKTYLREAYERGATIIVRCRAQRRPAYLEATSERAAAFYYRHGFEVADAVRLKKGPPLWLMWRDERDDSVGE